MLNAEIFIANIQKIRPLKRIEIDKKMENYTFISQEHVKISLQPVLISLLKVDMRSYILRTTCNFQEKCHLYSTLTDETNKLTYISVIIVSYWINVKVIMEHSPCIRTCRRFIRDRMQNSQIIQWLCIHYGRYKKCRAQVCADDDASAKDFINNFLYYSNKCLTKDRVQNDIGDFCAQNSSNFICRDRSCQCKAFYEDLIVQVILNLVERMELYVFHIKNVLQTMDQLIFAMPYLIQQEKIDVDLLQLLFLHQLEQVMTKLKPQLILNVILIQVQVSLVVQDVFKIQNQAHHTEELNNNVNYLKKHTGLDDKKNSTYEYLRTCAYYIIATADVEYVIFMKECIKKCIGCGDQETCAQFLGTSGRDYFWNTSTALVKANCTKNKCSDISGKNNKQCIDGMPPFKTTDDPFCIFDGTSYIIYGKNYNAFNRTEETCPTSLGRDCSCKATTVKDHVLRDYVQKHQILLQLMLIVRNIIKILTQLVMDAQVLNQVSIQHHKLLILERGKYLNICQKCMI
ncbi:unnamed protein product [Paramecium pentaurelia]|uniref:Uncharacterized protein n=1 Tax=Paramecium pentaurelia TaxID=43138 RepID=A0A8S1XCC9_9CILI|nr:unnamed protein product [Paramecium pentaurelia]